MKTSPAHKILVRSALKDVRDAQRLFNNFEFDQMVYFSQSVAPFRAIDGGDVQDLVTALSACQENTRVIYVTCSVQTEDYAQSIIRGAAEEACRRATHTGGINTVITPWLYSIEALQPSLTAYFEPGKRKLFCSAKQPVSFLAAEDLAALLYRMFEDWEPSLEPWFVPHAFRCAMAQLETTIQVCSEGDEIEFLYSEQAPIHPLLEGDATVLRGRYLWYPVYNILEDLPEIIRRYRAQRRSLMSRILSAIKANSRIVRLLELLFGCAVMEMTLKLSGISVQFSMVDFRLVFVVIMAMLYDTRMGVEAAACASVSLILAYAGNGIDALNLFYEPTNWLPFIAYFIVGAACGHIRQYDLDMLKFARADMESLSKRYDYLLRINQDVLQEKREYKQQIIGSRDSFGKIFDIVQQLNERHPKQILEHAIEVLEAVLGNHAVAVYNCGEQYNYARLMVSSRGLDPPYSLRMLEYYQRLEANKGEAGGGLLWVNRQLEAEMPAYLYGICKDGKITAVILLQRVGYDQMTLYYENLFRIVCGLVSASLLRAMAYQDAVAAQRRAPGAAHILREEFFREELQIAETWMDQKRAVYLLLRIWGEALSQAEMDQRVGACFRNTDVVGLCGGAYYALLPQAQMSDLPVLGKRIQNAGLQYQVIPMEEQRKLAG